MLITMRLRTDNAAFASDAGPEVSRILRQLADRTEGGVDAGEELILKDLNGNTVGQFNVDEE